MAMNNFWTDIFKEQYGFICCCTSKATRDFHCRKVKKRRLIYNSHH